MYREGPGTEPRRPERIVDKLKQGLEQMPGKLGELTAKRNQLVNRARVAATQSKVDHALKALDAGDPTSAIGRFEDRIRREEATVRASRNLPFHL
ncbi:PspA/IM30 family protein [Pseudarthrobacter sp. 902506025]|uniref:PspA/IM30 family protein n=1 Tax=Pseudarthrobacter sp. 902506025 TaxID=3155291 RepID=UPI003CC83541